VQAEEISKTLLAILKMISISLEYWVLNLTMCQNHLEALVKHHLPGPIPGISLTLTP
jgi:hypothetical protein